MKSGDLVKMKYTSFWQKKIERGGPHRIPYTEIPMLVYETAHRAVKVILPDGSVKHDLAEYYEVINESR